jgi:predicted urease superfamily metal-dependent hydrolase
MSATKDLDAKAAALLQRADQHADIVREAVDAAEVILRGAAASAEELDCLIARAAREFVDRALLALEAAMARKELGI